MVGSIQFVQTAGLTPSVTVFRPLRGLWFQLSLLTPGLRLGLDPFARYAGCYFNFCVKPQAYALG